MKYNLWINFKETESDTDKRHQAFGSQLALWRPWAVFHVLYPPLSYLGKEKKGTKMNIFYLHFYLFLPSRTKMMSKIFMKIMNYYLRLVKLTQYPRGLSYTKEWLRVCIILHFTILPLLLWPKSVFPLSLNKNLESLLALKNYFVDFIIRDQMYLSSLCDTPN